MKKYLQLMAVAIAVGMLGLCTTAVADIPDYVDYHATWDGAWTIEKDIHNYSNPRWEDDNTSIWVPNIHIPDWIKYVWLEIEWYAPPTPAPGIWIEAGDMTVDIETLPVVANIAGDGWTYSWILDPQPDWEKIHFPDSTYWDMTNHYDLKRIEVGTYCIPEPGTVSLLVIGSLVLGVVAVIRRKR